MAGGGWRRLAGDDVAAIGGLGYSDEEGDRGIRLCV